MILLIRTYLLRLLLLLTGLLTVGEAGAVSVKTDTLQMRFRLDSIHIDMSYADNARNWDNFERHFREHFINQPQGSIRLDVFSGASPEGTAAHNRWLGENRGIAIRRLVRQRLGSSVGSIIIHNEAARWEGLYESVAASSEPWRDEVLAIIEQPASADENRFDHRELKLRALRGGMVWPTLLQQYLAPLRSGATAILSWEPCDNPVVVHDTIVMKQPMPMMPTGLVYADSTGQMYRSGSNKPVAKPVMRYPVWILRSNLLLLATGTPNLQAEWSLGHQDKWSINVEGVWSWWTFAYNAYANEIIYGSVELRRWLGRRWRHHTLSGWHIGLGLGGGYGDVEWKSRGYQAEVFSAFVNIGWQGRFGRRKQWAFDWGIGLGYAYIPWRRYTGSSQFPVGKEEEHDDHLMWRETGRTNWIGTPHVNISLGYVFPQKDARWRRAQALQRDAVRYDYLHFRDSMKARKRYVDDSLKIARRQQLREIDMLPRAERKAALKQLAAADRQAKQEAKAAKRLVKTAKHVGVESAKPMSRKERRQQLRAEKAERRQQEEAIRRWAKTPEGRAAVRQTIADEKAARRRAKAEAKAARRQQKLDRKLSRMKMRSNSEHQRNLEKYQREVEKADYKYSIK